MTNRAFDAGIEVQSFAAGIPPKLRPWIEARQKFRLSHAQVQMARELGMTPRKLGGLNSP
jgi:hypothetical protein